MKMRTKLNFPEMFLWLVSVTLSYTIRGFFASVKLYKSSPYDKMINTNISVGLQISFACANGERILTR